jgi:relaxase-like protein
MIGRAIKGRGFRGLLNYLAGKHDSLLLGGDMLGRSPRALAREFGVVRQLRPGREEVVFHLALRPAPGETLTHEQWRAVAGRVLAHLGYTGSPHVLYLHRDAAEEHLHVVSSIIRYDGSVVSTSNDYFRVMEVLREVERDYGLRVVPHRESGKSPTREQAFKLLERTGEASVREALQRAVREAASDRPDVTTFVERLQARGIEVLPNVASTGRVTGISYLAQGYTFKGSTLGSAFSWRGIQERLGVVYEAERDLPALLAARTRVPASRPTAAAPTGETAAPPRSAGDARARSRAASTSGASGPRRPASVVTAAGSGHEALGHLAAIGSPRFQVLVLDLGRGRRQLLTALTPDRLAGLLPALSAASDGGAEILVRPSHHLHLSVLVGVRPEALARAPYAPDLAVRVGDTYELWFRHSHALGREERTVIGPLLARAFEVPADRATADYAHLAGFAATPVTFSGPPPARERATMPEMEDLGRAGAEAADPIQRIQRLESTAAELLAGMRGERETQAAVDELERATGPLLPTISQLHDRARAAGERFAEALARPAAAESLQEAARELGAARVALAEQGGRPDLATLSRADLDTHASLRGRLATAERRVEDAELQALARPSPAAAARLAAADLGRGALLEELASFEAARGLVPSREAQPGFLAALPLPPPPPPVPAGTPAATALELDAAQLRLHHAQLGAAHDHLAARLLPVERLLAADPRPAVAARFEHLLARLDAVDLATAGARRALSSVEAAMRDLRLQTLGEAVLSDPTPAHLGAYLRTATEGVAPDPSSRPIRSIRPDPRTAAEAVGRFLVEPTPERLARVRDLAVDHRAHGLATREDPLRQELAAARTGRRAAEGTVLGTDRPALAVLQRWSAAHDREAAAAARLFARAAPSPGRGLPGLRDILLRVRAGDRSGSTLADLARGTAREILAAGGPLPRPSRPARPPAEGLAPRDLLRIERAQAAAFLREVRSLLRDGTPRDPARLAVLHERLAAYQTVREQRTAVQDKLPTAIPLSPPRGASRDRSGRAAGAWAAQAAARGLPAEQIGAILSRHVQRSRYALPRFASSAGLDTVARLAHWGATAARRQVSPRSLLGHLERLAGAPVTPERFLLRVGLAAYSAATRALGLSR